MKTEILGRRMSSAWHSLGHWCGPNWPDPSIVLAALESTPILTIPLTVGLYSLAFIKESLQMIRPLTSRSRDPPLITYSHVTASIKPFHCENELIWKCFLFLKHKLYVYVFNINFMFCIILSLLVQFFVVYNSDIQFYS